VGTITNPRYRLIDKIVADPEDYVFSAARNYADLDNELEVVVLDIF
jgi:hypothetical protein